MTASRRISALRLGPQRLGKLQAEVMEVLWSADAWLTPRQVLVELPGSRAYTTIMTVLVRLADHGVLERRPVGRAFEYQAVLGREDFFAGRLAEVLRDSPDQQATLARFVADLSPSERSGLVRRLTETTGPQDDSDGA